MMDCYCVCFGVGLHVFQFSFLCLSLLPWVPYQSHLTLRRKDRRYAISFLEPNLEAQSPSSRNKTSHCLDLEVTRFVWQATSPDIGVYQLAGKSLIPLFASELRDSLSALCRSTLIHKRRCSVLESVLRSALRSHCWAFQQLKEQFP